MEPGSRVVLCRQGAWSYSDTHRTDSGPFNSQSDCDLGRAVQFTSVRSPRQVQIRFNYRSIP